MAKNDKSTKKSADKPIVKGKTKFQKGNTIGNRFGKGNTFSVGYGRPKKLPSLEKVMASILGGMTDDETKSGVHEIMEALKAQAKRGNVRAAEMLMDRGYGKQKQSLDVTTDGKEIETRAPVINIISNAPALAGDEKDVADKEKKK